MEFKKKNLAPASTRGRPIRTHAWVVSVCLEIPLTPPETRFPVRKKVAVDCFHSLRPEGEETSIQREKKRQGS